MNVEKAKYWRKQISKWRSSGMPMKVFCQREGLVLGTMSRWNWELKSPTVREAELERAQTPIEVVLGRYVVRLPPGAEAQQMRQVLEVLESRL